MAQHDYDIANAAGATVRADINNVLAAIVRKNDAATEPTTTFPNMWWYDSTLNLLNIRNEADNAWIIFAEFDQTNGLWIPRAIDYFRLEERSSSPTGVANTYLQVAKDVSGVTELFGIDSGDNEVQITRAGALKLDKPIEMIIDGGGSVITTGFKGYLNVRTKVEIVGVRVLADVSGSIVIDLWVDSYANFPPTVADTITASAKPTLSAAQKSEDTTLTGWSKTLNKGDVIHVEVDSAATVKNVNIGLEVKLVV